MEDIDKMKKMDIEKISNEATELIKYLQEKNLRPDEQVAALKSAATTIESVMSSEILTLWMIKSLTTLGKK